MKKISLFVAALAILAGCSQAPEPQAAAPAPVVSPPAPTCVYTYVNANTIVAWTGFKHGARVGVSGKFETFTISGSTPGTEPQNAVLGLSFDIDVNSINSEDPARDAKLKEFFFGAMSDTEAITGTVKEINGDDTEGSATIMIKMNGVEKEAAFAYTIDEEQKFSMKGAININDWDGAKALASINKACEEKHTGEGDTEAVTHPDFEIAVSTKLKKKCD